MIDLFRLLQYTCPLALASLGETVGQKAGLINIGLEGQMLTAAYFALLAAKDTGSPWLGLLAGVAAAVILGLAAGWFTVRRGIDQVVVGTAVNLGALGLTSTLFRSRFGQSGQLLSIPGIPSIAGRDGLDAVTILMLLSVGLVTWLLFRTGWGLAARSVGEYPKAAEAAGFSVARLRAQAVVISSVFAGLAGAYLTLGVNRSFAEGMTSGRGFVAIAMVTFGRWKPIWVLGASLLVGYAESLQFTLQLQRSDIPYQFFKALPYVIALGVLILVGKGTQAPRSLGTPYRRES
jgi:simple sugar transport system permease protein